MAPKTASASLSPWMWAMPQVSRTISTWAARARQRAASGTAPCAAAQNSANASVSVLAACKWLPSGFDRRDQLRDGGLCVPVQHAGLIEHEQGIVDAGKALALAALDDDDVLRLVGIQD